MLPWRDGLSSLTQSHVSADGAQPRAGALWRRSPSGRGRWSVKRQAQQDGETLWPSASGTTRTAAGAVPSDSPRIARGRRVAGDLPLVFLAGQVTRIRRDGFATARLASGGAPARRKRVPRPGQADVAKFRPRGRPRRGRVWTGRVRSIRSRDREQATVVVAWRWLAQRVVEVSPGERGSGRGARVAR